MTMHLAPNGKPSNLTHEQWHLVRTPEFKAWFGDWENDPKDASKVVDENGEPKVVYHGTPNKRFNEFNIVEGASKKSKMQLLFGIHFASKLQDAEIYTKSKGSVYDVFLNLKNVLNLSEYYKVQDEKFDIIVNIIKELKFDKRFKTSLDYDLFTENGSYKGKSDKIQTAVLTQFMLDSVPPKLAFYTLKKYGFDGIIYTPYQPKGFNSYSNFSQSYIAFEPNQIKLADGSNTTFDSNNPDIRYEEGGLIKNEEFYKWFLDWYKNDVQGMTIMFTLPSEFTRLSNTSENDIILDVFQKNDNVDAKIYLQQIVDNADKYGVTLYVHPIPRTHRLMSEEHKSKITTDYLIAYFEKFDFVIDADRFFMVRKPKVNYSQGGKVEDMTIQELNTEYIRLNKKYLKEQKIQRKFADEKNWVGHDKQIDVLESINDRMGEISTVLEIKEDEARKNRKNRFADGGEITNACIEEVISIINSIQKVKDYYIHDGKLVIVFVEDLMVYGIDMINYHMEQFKDCHDVIEPEAIVNDKENYKSIYFILKKDDATIGQFKEGGSIDLFGQIAGLMAKGTEYIEGYDENKRYILSADKEIYFKNQDNIDRIEGKPKGLWYSIGNSWAEYIYSEIPDKIDFYNYLYEIKVTNKIKIINTIEEAIEFSKKYGDSNGYTTEGVDWGEVAKDYSGIEIKDPYNFSRIEYNQLLWMYGWDIPSGCIWDKSGIESIEFIQKSQSLYKEGGEIKSNTEKLISEIKKHSTITEGRVSTAIDGSKYRYDNYVLKYPSTANWLVNLFEKAAQENNKKNATQFSYKDKYSISFQRPKFKGEPNGKIIMSELVELDGQFKEGGEVENKETYSKWKSLVNMSSSELERFYNSEEGKKAGLTPQQANQQGIDSGRESARMILKMKNTKVSDWTPNMWRWAKKQISFISRMSGVKGSLYDDKGNKTRKHLALLIWGNNPEKKNNGGEIYNQKNTNIMESVKFNGLPHIDTISDNDLILIKEEVFVGDIDKPMHKGTRYVSCKVMSKGGMADSLNLKVIKSVGANALSTGQTITRPIANLVSNGRKMLSSFKDGGELNPDNKVVKQYFAHDSGNAGGVLVGKRHSEGGIKATNNSTGQPIEMEGGEVVITRGAVSNPKKYSFEGKEMTTREVLSKLNVDGGGVSFADGGDVPEKMNCGCSTMKLGGETMSTQDFINMSENEYQDIRLREGIQKEKKDHYSTLSKLNSGAITIEEAFREIAQKEMSLDSKYPFAE